MNELMYIYLKLEDMNAHEADALIERMDDMLLSIGLKYTGFQNVYTAVNSDDRDDVFYNAEEALHTCEFLKGKYNYVSIGNEVMHISMKDIDCTNMEKPNETKWNYYNEYYQKYHCLPHDILVDENNCIVDGYISYLLAQKNDVKFNILDKASIYSVVRDKPHKKVVIGRHVKVTETGVHVHTKKRYTWIYDLNAPVVCGDVLKVKVKNGYDFMVVDKIAYIAGEKFCSAYKQAISHTGIRMEEQV